MPWLTKDNSPALVSRAIFVPDDDDWWADFIGAFYELTRPENWEKDGDLTPDEMAAAWDAALRATQP